VCGYAWGQSALNPDCAFTITSGGGSVSDRGVDWAFFYKTSLRMTKHAHDKTCVRLRSCARPKWSCRIGYRFCACRSGWRSSAAGERLERYQPRTRGTYCRPVLTVVLTVCLGVCLDARPGPARPGSLRTQEHCGPPVRPGRRLFRRQPKRQAASRCWGRRRLLQLGEEEAAAAGG
jgi:hypothetical protein